MRNYWVTGLLSAAAVVALPSLLNAAEEGQTETPISAQATVSTRLAYGVQDVLSLRAAQVSEDVIATYIQTSGTTYSLRPSDIVHLHNQGVSDRVINLMLSQGRVAAEVTNQAPAMMPVVPVVNVATTAPQTQAASEPALFIPGQNAAEIAAACTPVMQEAPSTLYVIPYGSSCRYRSTYSLYGNYYPTYGAYGYGYTPSYTVRLGGHSGGHRVQSYSHHRR